MSRRALLPALAFAAMALVACGSDDTEPKRVVEARVEALRYFAPGTPFIAIADPSPGGVSDPIAALDGLAAIEAVSGFAASDLGFVERQGIAAGDLAQLLRVPDPQIESESAQVAFGVTPTGTPKADVLITIVTARPRYTRLEVEQIVRDNGMRRSESVDQADVYDGDDATLSVRDGVVLIANSPALVEEAIERRDADPEKRLDEGRIDDALEPFPEDAALLAFLDIGELVRLDPAVAALAGADGLGFLRDLGDAGASITPGEPAEIRLSSELDEDQADAVPVGEEPTRFDLSEEDLRRATAGKGSNTSGFSKALVALAPAELTVSATPDELRALVRAED